MVFLVFVLGVKSDFEVNLSGQIQLTFLRFRVCLVGGRIGWMENNREKMGLCVLWLGRGKRKYLGGVQAFSTETHTKLFTLKWR